MAARLELALAKVHFIWHRLLQEIILKHTKFIAFKFSPLKPQL